MARFSVPRGIEQARRRVRPSNALLGQVPFASRNKRYDDAETPRLR